MEDRNTAGKILGTAYDVVMKQRADQHGSAENSFQMIADFWNSYLRHAMWKRHVVPASGEGEFKFEDYMTNLQITPGDVAQMMTLLKAARATYGDPTHADHYIDTAGYAGLAGMLFGAVMPNASVMGEASVAKAMQVDKVSHAEKVRRDYENNKTNLPPETPFPSVVLSKGA